MGLHLRFAVAGAGLGLLLGVLGGFIGSVPFGVAFLRTSVSVLVAAGIASLLPFIFGKFLPELLSSSESDQPAGEHRASKVDITISEDEGAAILSEDGETHPRSSAFAESEDQEAGDGSLIEEVSENSPKPASFAGDNGFDEDAFYQGVERLPDIGGFSEHFQGSESETDAEPSSPGVADFDDVSTGSSRGRSQSSQSNMDPALVAQAIRTALKKDEG